MIGAYRGISMLSRAIQWQTWSKYSHIAEIDRKTGEVVEAWQSGGVRHLPSYHDGHTKGTVIELFEVEGASYDLERRVFERMLTQAGKGYDFTGIWGFLRRSDRENAERWFCSELDFWAWREEGIELLRRVLPCQVSPGLEVRSPLLRYVGFLTVGEDKQDLGVVPISRIAARNQMMKDQKKG